MRGKPSSNSDTRAVIRITPAHAGKTQQQIPQRSVCWDHPRACGENGGGARGEGVYRGSPPRMRGKLVDIVVWVVGLRITPAHAGKTKRLYILTAYKRDHPRACGENK